MQFNPPGIGPKQLGTGFSRCPPNLDVFTPTHDPLEIDSKSCRGIPPKLQALLEMTERYASECFSHVNATSLFNGDLFLDVLACFPGS
ncbi:hypothetical protein L207DRAFT_249431 [Hyaloscypha variabilis F]|uniref:Uncharacterized protein n=1 Tax=Hyaloscypha variabilis (strain UAMH 11265 / GT02V1 / F) TaxID=1149755 RepID=A0A2J6S348_HYAVF|nr:hypothetical protein L207DRAFT_249431 [Hyaloscypha variabilis F]